MRNLCERAGRCSSVRKSPLGAGRPHCPRRRLGGSGPVPTVPADPARTWRVSGPAVAGSAWLASGGKALVRWHSDCPLSGGQEGHELRRSHPRGRPSPVRHRQAGAEPCGSSGGAVLAWPRDCQVWGPPPHCCCRKPFRFNANRGAPRWVASPGRAPSLGERVSVRRAGPPVRLPERRASHIPRGAMEAGAAGGTCLHKEQGTGRSEATNHLSVLGCGQRPPRGRCSEGTHRPPAHAPRSGGRVEL